MRQGAAAEAVDTEEKNERPSSSNEHEQNDGSPWLLEWFPGFDIPIGLEGRAYLRRLLNHRRAEDPAACETLLAAHGIKLGRGVPGHTSNWGSMKVRELLHAAYLLGCWSAVEKLCINFCHANGLKTEWIRELKAKGGKQCVTLANLQNYRKKNREKKRTQTAETRDKKPSMAAAAPSSTAPFSATASPGCVGPTASSVTNTAVPPLADGDVPSFCKQVEGANGDDISCSSVVSKASKKSRRSSAFSCDQQAPCPYASPLLSSQQTALPEPPPTLGFGCAAPTSQFLPSDAQNSMPKHEITVQQGGQNFCSTQSPVQLTLPLLHNASSDPDVVANTDSDSFLVAPASQTFDPTSSFTCVLEEDATISSSVTPRSSASVTRMRRPKRRNGKAKSNAPRKRRQVSTRKSSSGAWTDSLSSVTSSEHPAAHGPKKVVHVPAGDMQCEENKFMAGSELIPVREHQSVTANACDAAPENQSFLSTWSLQGNLTRASQRTTRTATSAAPSVTRSATRFAAGVPRSADDARQTSPQCCHRWFTASLFWTDSSDNGSSETESLHSKTSTCTTTSSFSDSDHSFHEGCRCSFFRAKRVNFAGKKPAFTCFHSSCSRAGVTEASVSLCMTAPIAKEHARDPTETAVAPAWTEVAEDTHQSPIFPECDLPLVPASHHQHSNFLTKPTSVPAGSAVAIHGNSLSGIEGSKPLTAGFWHALPTFAAAAVAAQECQEVCTPDPFCGDVGATTVHFSPQITASVDLSAPSYKTKSERMGSDECAQVLPAKREGLSKEWNMQVRHSAAGADPAFARADKGVLASFNRAWRGPVQATSEIHQQKDEQHFASARCKHHLRNSVPSVDVLCDRVDYCNRRSSGPPGQVGDNAAAAEPDICNSVQHEQQSALQDRREEGSSSQPQHFSALRREVGERLENHISLQIQQDNVLQRGTEDTDGGNNTSSKELSADTHRAMLMKGEEHSVRKRLLQHTTHRDGEGSAPQASSATEEGIKSDTPATHRVCSYIGNLLSSPLPCAETAAGTFPFDNHTHCQAQNTGGAPGLDTTSRNTETFYSSHHFPTKDTWMYSSVGRTGDYYTWGDDLRTENEPASVAPSTAADIATLLLPPRSAALAGSSAAAATAGNAQEAYRVPRRHTAEVCSVGEDEDLANPFPLQLPPLAEAQDLFFPSDVATAEDWESQMAGWRKSSTTDVPDLGSNLTATAEARLPTATAAALENSAASPRRPPNAAALSTEWGGAESNENCCADKMAFQPPTEDGNCANMLEASYGITCGHSRNSPLAPGTTVQLTVRRLAEQ